jgi:hypothetical protein
MPPKSGSLLFNSVTDQAQTIPVVGADGASYNVQTRMFRPNSPILTLNDPFLAATGGSAVSRPVNLLYITPCKSNSTSATRAGWPSVWLTRTAKRGITLDPIASAKKDAQYSCEQPAAYNHNLLI